jgi:hypothetical protein
MESDAGLQHLCWHQPTTPTTVPALNTQTARVTEQDLSCHVDFSPVVLVWFLSLILSEKESSLFVYKRHL